MNDTETRVSLVVVEGVHAGRALPVRLPFLIGRAPECNLRPASEAVSLHHCIIKDRDGRPVLRDLGSDNGTFLNDNLLMIDYQLCEGDELRLGPLRFIVRMEEPIDITDDATNEAAARFLLDEDQDEEAATDPNPQPKRRSVKPRDDSRAYHWRSRVP